MDAGKAHPQCCWPGRNNKDWLLCADLISEANWNVMVDGLPSTMFDSSDGRKALARCCAAGDMLARVYMRDQLLSAGMCVKDWHISSLNDVQKHFDAFCEDAKDAAAIRFGLFAFYESRNTTDDLNDCYTQAGYYFKHRASRQGRAMAAFALCNIPGLMGLCDEYNAICVETNVPEFVKEPSGKHSKKVDYAKMEMYELDEHRKQEQARWEQIETAVDTGAVRAWTDTEDGQQLEAALRGSSMCQYFLAMRLSAEVDDKRALGYVAAILTLLHCSSRTHVLMARILEALADHLAVKHDINAMVLGVCKDTRALFVHGLVNADATVTDLRLLALQYAGWDKRYLNASTIMCAYVPQLRVVVAKLARALRAHIGNEVVLWPTPDSVLKVTGGAIISQVQFYRLCVLLVSTSTVELEEPQCKFLDGYCDVFDLKSRAKVRAARSATQVAFNEHNVGGPIVYTGWLDYLADLCVVM